MVIFVVLGILASLLIGVIVDAWVLTVLWKWFIVSTFGLPQISIIQAIGISLVVGLFAFKLPEQKLDEDEDVEDKLKKIGKKIGGLIAIPLFVLFLGWITHFFM